MTHTTIDTPKECTENTTTPSKEDKNQTTHKSSTFPKLKIVSERDIVESTSTQKKGEVR